MRDSATGPTPAGPRPAELAALEADHRNFRRLLTEFENELERFRDAEPTVDYAIMRDIVHYMTSYSDQVHHPLEDLIAGRLSPAEPAVADLRQEHESLTRAGADLLRILEEVIADAMIRRDAVERHAREYVQRLRAHMDREEAGLLPLAERRLGAADWASIRAAARNLEDPLFGQAADPKYRMLRDRLSAPTPGAS